MSYVLTIVLQILVFVLKGRQLLDNNDVTGQLLDNLFRRKYDVRSFREVDSWLGNTTHMCNIVVMAMTLLVSSWTA